MIRLKLSALMGERKLRISDVMRDTGISRNALTRIYREEVDRLDLEILEKLCLYLDVDISDMLKLEHDSRSNDSRGSRIEQS